MRLRRYLWPALLVAAVAGAWFWLATRPAPVDVAEIATGEIRAFVEEEGRTRVVDRYVIAAPVDGRLLRLELREGDPVAKGAFLAEIDPLLLQTRVEEGEARIRGLSRQIEGVDKKKPKPEEIERAKAMEMRAREAHELAAREVEQAREGREKALRDLERARSLAASGNLISAEDLDTSEVAARLASERYLARENALRLSQFEERAAALEATILESRLGDFDWEAAHYREQIAAIEAELKSLREDLRRTRILSPCDGVVLNRFLESETTLAAGTAILELGDLRRLEVEADFLSEDAAHMREGMPAEVFGRALGGRAAPAKVKRIYPSAFKKISSLGIEQQRVTVVFAFDELPEGLGDRFRVDVRVLFEERAKVTLAPEEALFRYKGEWHAFRVEGGRARLVRVRTGVEDGRRREVLHGLAPGDLVLVHPETTIADGARVEVRRSAR